MARQNFIGRGEECGCGEALALGCSDEERLGGRDDLMK